MRNKRSSLDSESPSDGGINLTPLIDVVFVVLILFILIAPMIEVDRIKLAEGPHREQTSQATIEATQAIVIHVKEDNTVWVGKRPIAMDLLPPLLKALHVQNPTRIPQLYHDERATFGTYQKVKNAVEDAGFSELDIVLEAVK